ncbi:MAG TPA: pilus assembly protein N-terminal domain-containing protein, partial [Rhodospirillales bacterium]
MAVAAVMSLCPAAQAQRVVPLTADMELEAASTPAAETVLLSIGKAHLVSLAEPIRDVVIANPAIADVIVKTASQAYLVAQEIGETNVFFVNEDGEVVRHIVVRVEIDLVAAREALGALLPDSAITLRSVNGNIVMSGAVRASKQALDAADLVARFAGEGDEGAERVVNMLRVTEDQQVLLKIRVAEMQRSVLKTLGFDTPFSRGDWTLDFSGLAGAVESIVTGTVLIDDLGFSSVSFNALESQGLAKTLAEPVLTAISGETANFVAGGEFPVPTQASQGVVAFTFREFGVVSSFTPV